MEHRVLLRGGKKISVIAALLMVVVLAASLLVGCAVGSSTEEAPEAQQEHPEAAGGSAEEPAPRDDSAKKETVPESEVPDEGGSTVAPAQPNSTTSSASGESEATMFYIHVNGEALAVTPAENSSAQALLDLLADGDVTVAAHDYGNFEKVGALPQSLPTNDEPITTEPGDVILYQGNQITVYYDTNNWNFTRLGKIEGVDASELKRILGNGDAELRLSLSA